MIVENCGNTLILRCSASEQGGTSQFASRLIGQREVVHTMRSKTWGAQGGWTPSTTETEQRSIEAAIMPSELERLADLEGFLKFASHPDWIHLTLPFARHPTKVRGGRAGTTAPEPPSATRGPAAAAPQKNPPPADPSKPVESPTATRRRTRKAGGQ